MRRRLLTGLTGVLLASALGLGSGCGSLPRQELAAHLKALPKNAAVGPLEHVSILVPGAEGRGPSERELTFVRRPAEASPAAQPPLVLVHGTPSTLYSWAELVYGEGALPRDRDVYMLEVGGHGVAEGPALEDFDDAARFIVAALAGLDLEQAHLVGQSYGGEFVWRAALLAPSRVASVTLINSSGLRRRDEDWLDEELVMRENPLAWIGWRFNSRERIAAALEPHYERVPAGRVEEMFWVCENARNWSSMIALARDENGSRQDELAQLRVPVLLLWGAEEIAYPPEVYGQEFLRRLPDARLQLVTGCGHYPHEERPRATAERIERFIAEVEAPSEER